MPGGLNMGFAMHLIVFNFSSFFSFLVPCAKLRWPLRTLFRARSLNRFVSYRIVSYAVYALYIIENDMVVKPVDACASDGMEIRVGYSSAAIRRPIVRLLPNKPMQL